MKHRERLAAWAWDLLPGGVPAQNRLFDRLPRLARWFEDCAWLRDYEKAQGR